MAETAEVEKSPDELREEIRQLRREMTATLQEIQERISPAHVKGYMKESAREKARMMKEETGQKAKQVGAGIVDAIKQNPLPVALAGTSLYLLLKKRGEREEAEREKAERPYYYAYPEEPYASEEEMTGGYGREAGEVKERAQEKAGELKERASYKAGQLKETMYGKKEELGAAAREKAYRARSRFRQAEEENPFAVIAAAFGLGLIFGLLVPETGAERRAMGETGEKLAGKAEEKLREASETAREEMQKVGA